MHMARREAESGHNPNGRDSTVHRAAFMFRTNKNQSVDDRTLCTKVIYNKQLHGTAGGGNMAKFGASPIKCVCRMGDVQHHKGMAVCRSKHEGTPSSGWDQGILRLSGG